MDLGGLYLILSFGMLFFRQSGGGHTSAPLRPGGRVSSVRMKGNDASGAMGSSVSGGPSGTQGGDGGNRDSRRRRWGTGMSSGGIDGGLSSGGNAWRGMGAEQSRKGKGGVNDSKYVGEEEWMQVEPTPGSQVRSGGDGKGSNKNSQASSHGVSGAGPELETETGKQGEPPSSPGFAAQATGALPSVPVRSTRDPYYPGKAWVGRKEEERNAVSITTQDCLKDQFEAEATSLAEAEIVQSEGGGSLEESVEHIAVEVDQHIVAAERVGRPQMVEDEEEKELPIFRESEEVVGIAGEDGRHLEKLDGGSFGNQTATVPPPTIGIAEAQNSREPSWGSDLSSSLNYIQRGSGSYAAVADKYAQSGSSSYSLASDPIIVRPTKVDWGGGAASHLLQNPVDGGTIHHRLGSSPVTFDRAVVPPLRVSSSSPPRTSPVESECSWINLKGNPQLAAHPTAIVHPPAPGMTEESHAVFSSLDMPMSSHPWAANSHPISEGVGHLPGFRHSSSDEDLVQIFTQLGSAGNEETGSGGNGGQAPVQSSTSGVFRKGGGVNLLKSDIMHGNAVTHGHDFFLLGHSTTSPSQPPVGHFTSTLPISSSMTSLCSKNNEVGGGRPNLHVNPNYLNK